MTKFTWTDENVNLLRCAAASPEGWSASAIAAMLGHGCTRNAVIGKAARIGLRLHGKAGGCGDCVRYATAAQVEALSRGAVPPRERKPRAATSLPRTPTIRTGDRVTGAGLPAGSAVIVAVPPAPPGCVGIADLGPYQCPAIVAGEPTEAETVRYCGCARAPGKRWCAEHHRRYRAGGGSVGSRPFQPRGKKTGFAIRHGR